MIKSLNTRKYNILFIALCIWITSCRGTDNAITDENNSGILPNVIVQLVGAEVGQDNPEKIASINGKKSINKIQEIVAPFDGMTTVTATLTPEQPALRSQASINPMAVTTPEITELGKDIKYNVAVYDTNGNFVNEKTFTYQQNDTNGFNLNGGQNYNFVAYSINSKTTVPTVGNSPRTLATDKLNNVNGDLMYFKRNMTVSGNGTNYIDVVLKHKYSIITSKLDARGVGVISSVGSANIGPVSSSANISLSNGDLTYNATTGTTAPVVNFKTFNNETVTSDPTLVISDNTSTAKLAVNNVVIDGVMGNVALNDVKIIPGVKYNLNLRFSPCRESIDPTPFSISSTSPTVGTRQTFNMPATDFGFVLDITNLDNSFNMIINGIQLATQEIQFQKSAGTQTVAFQDGSKYEEGGIPAIWQMGGGTIARVVISKTGQVSMFGVKTTNGGTQLYPLVLINGNSLNSVTWNTNSPNTVEVNQKPYGSNTRMGGTGTGKKIIQCVQ
jgi:hypothetical protein